MSLPTFPFIRVVDRIRKSSRDKEEDEFGTVPCVLLLSLVAKVMGEHVTSGACLAIVFGFAHDVHANTIVVQRSNLTLVCFTFPWGKFREATCCVGVNRRTKGERHGGGKNAIHGFRFQTVAETV